MRQIDWYLDEARRRVGLKSDHELSAWLGMSRTACTQWRTRRHWPKGPTMERLADACGIDRQIALAELGAWKEPDVATWRRLVDFLTRHAAALVTLIAVYFGSGDGGAQAAVQGANIAPPALEKLYIMRQLDVGKCL